MGWVERVASQNRSKTWSRDQAQSCKSVHHFQCGVSSATYHGDVWALAGKPERSKKVKIKAIEELNGKFDIYFGFLNTLTEKS